MESCGSPAQRGQKECGEQWVKGWNRARAGWGAALAKVARGCGISQPVSLLDS